MFVQFKHMWNIFVNHQKSILLETIDPVMRALLVRTPHMKQLALEIFRDIVKTAKDDTELFTNLKEKTTRVLENIAAEGLLDQEFLDSFIKGYINHMSKLND